MNDPAETTRPATPDERAVARRRILRLTRIAAIVLIGVGLAGLVAVGVRSLREQPEQPAPVAQGKVPGGPAPVPTPIAHASAPAPAPAPEAAPEAVPRLSALEESFLAAETPGEAIQALQAAFDARKAWEEGDIADYPVIIALCAGLKEKWPVTSEACDSMRLAARCWELLGEVEKAQDAYIAYADYKGALARQRELKRGKSPEQAEAAAVEVASREILSKAQTLYGDEDYSRAFSYCDLLLARYPTHERGLAALQMHGRYAVRHRRYGEAIRLFRQVIEINPDSRAAERARESLSSALGNAGRHREAAQVWLESGGRAKTEHERANYTYNAGGYLAACGKTEDAAALFEKVIEEYPEDNPFAGYARETLDKLRQPPGARKRKAVDVRSSPLVMKRHLHRQSFDMELRGFELLLDKLEEPQECRRASK